MEHLYERFMTNQILTNEEKEQLKNFLLEDLNQQRIRLEQAKALLPVNPITSNSVALNALFTRIVTLIQIAGNEMNNTYNILFILLESDPVIENHLGPGLDYTEATGSTIDEN